MHWREELYRTKSLYDFALLLSSLFLLCICLFFILFNSRSWLSTIFYLFFKRQFFFDFEDYWLNYFSEVYFTYWLTVLFCPRIFIKFSEFYSFDIKRENSDLLDVWRTFLEKSWISFFFMFTYKRMKII